MNRLPGQLRVFISSRKRAIRVVSPTGRPGLVECEQKRDLEAALHWVMEKGPPTKSSTRPAVRAGKCAGAAGHAAERDIECKVTPQAPADCGVKESLPHRAGCGNDVTSIQHYPHALFTTQTHSSVNSTPSKEP